MNIRWALHGRNPIYTCPLLLKTATGMNFPSDLYLVVFPKKFSIS